MMEFINNYLNIVLTVIVILTVFVKIKGIIWFIKLGAESPNPQPRIQALNRLKIYEALFIILVIAFIFLAFDFGWMSIVFGIAAVIIAEFLVIGLIFLPTVIYNIFYKISGREKRDIEKLEDLYNKDK